MQLYVGYGFDANDVENSALVEMMRKYDPRRYEDAIKELREDFPGEDNVQKYLESYLSDFLDGSAAEYLCDIINRCESTAAGTGYIVTDYDQYLVFESIRFADDEKRASYIKSEEDFIQMIGRYVPVNGLTFGNICTGSDFVDLEVYME